MSSAEMNEHHCDLHIHSCLSPCADNENTPNNIIGMALVNGLDIIALTDHNSVANCRATVAVGAEQGVIVIPGMELTTAEEIHVVCLFPDCDAAEAFGGEIENRLMKIANRTDLFGNQLIMDGQDSVVGEYPWLLPNATDVSFDAVPALVSQFGGICMPAHVDRHSNGVLAVLGELREDMGFSLGEISRHATKEDYGKRFPFLKFFRDSDAHYLWDMAEADGENLILGDFTCARDVLEEISLKKL